MTINILMKGSVDPSERFLLNGTIVTPNHHPFVPCRGHFSDHYGVAIDDFIVINCAAAQTSGLEFMTEALQDPMETMWKLFLHPDAFPYRSILTQL